MYKKVLSKAPNGITYIYLDEPYYDKAKGKSSHRRICVGKLDENGNERFNERYSSIMSEGKLKAPSVRLEGERLLLDNIAKASGIRKTLEEAYGKESADKCLALASYLASGGRRLRDASSWLELRGYGYKMDRKELISLLSSLDTESLSRFYKLWGERKGKGKTILYLLSPLPGYGSMAGVEDNLQLALVSSTKLPLSLHMIPCGLNVSSLYSWLSSEPSLKESDEIIIVGGKGLQGNMDINALAERGIGFTLPMPLDNKIFNDHYGELTSISSIMVDKDYEEIHAITITESTPYGKIWKHVYLDSLNRERMNEAFMKRYERCREDADEAFIEKYLDNPDAAGEFLKGYSSCWALVSNTEQSARNALCQYRTRNDMESHFADVPENWDPDRSLDNTPQGKLFLSFLSLVLVSGLKDKVSRTGLKRKHHYNWKDVLDKASTYSSVLLPGSPVPLYTALSDEQRIIFEAFKLL